MITYFKKALNNKGFVFAADSSATAPALQEADAAFIISDIYHPLYIKELLTICRERRVRMVIPLNDLELPLLAANKELLHQHGIIIVVSDEKIIAICHDKLQTLSFGERHGIHMPASFFSVEEAVSAHESGVLSFPVLIKPRWGSSSFGIVACHDMDHLDYHYQIVKKNLSESLFSRISSTDRKKCVMIQQIINGQEYGLDIVNDLSGRYVCTFVKRKLAMRAGETDRAITVENNELTNIGEKIGKALGHIGVLDCDIIVDEHGCFLIDINPRFGGGYPFSHVAGANIPAALIAWANGKKPDNAWLKTMAGVTAAKYDNLIVVRS